MIEVSEVRQETVSKLKTSIPSSLINITNNLTYTQYRLVLLAISLINRDKYYNLTPLELSHEILVLDITDYVIAYNIPRRNAYDNILLSMEKSWEYNENSIDIVSYSRFNGKEGKIYLTFTEEFLQLILDNSISYKLSNITKLKSVHSIKLYEVCKKYRGKKSVTFILDSSEKKNFREVWNVSGGAYEIFGQLKKHVIDPAIKDVNYYSDLEVSAEYTRHGRKVTGITFIIGSKGNSGLLEAEENVVQN